MGVTTYILSFRPSLRALRLVLASLLVLGMTVVPRPSFVVALTFWVSMLALSWLIVPRDRRWFIPGTLIFVLDWFIIGPTVVRWWLNSGW
jgi:hypothetical protein